MGLKLIRWETTVLMLEAIKTDGLKNTQSKTIHAFSDIIPEKLTYKTINIYPHSKKLLHRRIRILQWLYL